MNGIAVPLLVAAALVITGCIAVRDGIVPIEARHALSAEAFSVALIGDIPYSDRQIELLDHLITAINADPSVRFVMHAGDIKGRAPCDDQLFVERFDQFQKFQKPFIYTPGDNDWTDCHREGNGRYHPLERLAFLRRVFFRNPSQSTGGWPIPVRSQGTVPGFESFIENILFVEGRVVFATVHVVGSNNGLVPWVGLDPSDSFDRPRRDRIEEFRAREDAAIHWLEEIFRVAETMDSPGVLILIQANPRFEVHRDREGRTGFNRFLDTLRDLTVGYGKPVLLAHGDWHYLRIDKPMHKITQAGEREPIQSLIRIQIPGSPHVRWLKIAVDPQSPEVFLLVEPFVRKQDSLPW